MIRVILTRGLFATIDDEDSWVVELGKWFALRAGTTNKVYYAAKDLDRFGNRKILRMHRVIVGALGSEIVDHINGDTLDNRRENLRKVSRYENSLNSVKWAESGYKGVYRANQKQEAWVAKIVSKGRQTYLGTFHTRLSAALAYDTKARELHGEFACVNFPKEGEQSAGRHLVGVTM